MKILKVPYKSLRYGIDTTVEVKLDDHWYERLKSYKLNVIHKPPGGNDGYYFRKYQDGKYIYLHRLICGASSRDLVDHINRDTLDLQEKNLRIATHLQNSINNSRKSGRYKGVKKFSNSFKAIAYKDKVIYTAGPYRTELEAARGYNELAKFLHGEFAYLNDVE